ncbi:MAG TPA: DUF6638 family protein [Chitinophagales bacterium]|nr:DUF6638 family protein [Chitinophagales bacterium]
MTVAQLNFLNNFNTLSNRKTVLAITDPVLKPVSISDYSLLGESGLHEQGLLHVYEPHIVERYNECLKAIGLEPTKLDHFSIDGMGFSPEIAAEKVNLQYLSLDGISNPFAIIISPQQQGLPVYAPYHSFDGDLMDEVFRLFHRQIADLTLRTGIYIDIDEGLSRITVPKDLLMVEWIVCRFNVLGNISKDAKRQREIVSLLHKGENWTDSSLIDELIKNIETNGDLRYEHLELTDLPFTDIQTFYTSAFGGVYVFRDIAFKGASMMVLESPAALPESGDGYEQYVISDPNLRSHLGKHNIIDFQPSHYAEREPLERLCECLFIDALYRHDETIDVQTLTAAQVKKLVLMLIKEGVLTSHYEQLYNLMRLGKRRRVMELKEASQDLQLLLLHPHKHVKGLARFVVHRLLVQMMPVNILDLYTYAKDTFLKMYLDWPLNKRSWAIEFLKKHYLQSYYSQATKTVQIKSS